MRGHVDEVAKAVLKQTKAKIDYKVGTMIEVPRATLVADELAHHADFFSFGTNDLTQMTYGFSRDDVGSFVPQYIREGILEDDPFAKLDQEGIGQLVDLGISKGRTTNKYLKIGICGEHGGEPSSIDFCYRAGMNYVSCSPFRVPVARLAAAQSVLRNNK
jgi:pyruvate,orthophosphate dikinase